ncbi:peroxide stress protein YaaA [Rheinheimera sp.]|uniref:peroxide stress protein YaaA n=1 Tax=Rheinheimera sp. TaxID=1869214 RepID=UPI00307D67C5
MLTVISPAKDLDYQSPLAVSEYSQPALLAEAQALMPVCRDLSPQQLSSLMGISDKLAGLNAARFAQWSTPFTPDNARQAVFAFNGDVYQGLQAQSLSREDLAFAQQHLRILSGLYGVLRPLDLMQPYRLEMGTSLANPRGKNLYQFWGSRISEALNLQLEQLQSDTLLNLASQEYFKAVDKKALKARVVNVEFKDFKNGQYKVISFYAKKARGLMARFVTEQRLTSVAGIKDFDVAGYRFSAEQSTPEQFVFTRQMPAV